jgi:GNAT superfamily N-acetyltransferase
MIRRARTSADFELCARICNAVQPDEPVTAEQLELRPTGAFLLHPGGGYALVDRSSIVGSAFTMVRVEPEARRRGIGSALLDAATDEARALGPNAMWGRVAEDDAESMSFVSKRCFEEVDRDVALVRELRGDEAASPAGIVPLAEEHRAGAYAVAVECTPDMVLAERAEAPPYEQWAADQLSGPAAFVALDRGEVVGYAVLHDVPAVPGRLEHGMTAVRRSHRRRGIATALKQAELAWAAAQGYRELVTWTDEGNVGMRAVNERLGYVRVPASIRMRRPLP